MAEKSKDAFRTISEVADWLDVPTHVLRFWESRFSQIKPVKRAGGRRYYRPSDMRIIGGVKVLLHDQGMTIRGVQKMFREEGLKHVSSFSPGLYGEDIVEEVALTEEALERASRPAPAASRTHGAAPDPVPPVAAEEDAIDTDPPPMFRRTSRLVEPAATADVEETDTPAASSTTEPDAQPSAEGASAEEAQPVLPLIPPTPDVPAEDPTDDDAAFSAQPGIAARLIAQKPDDLKAHRAVLGEASTRLRALLEKVS